MIKRKRERDAHLLIVVHGAGHGTETVHAMNIIDCPKDEDPAEESEA